MEVLRVAALDDEDWVIRRVHNYVREQGAQATISRTIYEHNTPAIQYMVTLKEDGTAHDGSRHTDSTRHKHVLDGRVARLSARRTLHFLRGLEFLVTLDLMNSTDKTVVHRVLDHVTGLRHSGVVLDDRVGEVVGNIDHLDRVTTLVLVATHEIVDEGAQVVRRHTRRLLLAIAQRLVLGAAKEGRADRARDHWNATSATLRVFALRSTRRPALARAGATSSAWRALALRLAAARGSALALALRLAAARGSALALALALRLAVVVVLSKDASHRNGKKGKGDTELDHCECEGTGGRWTPNTGRALDGTGSPSVYAINLTRHWRLVVDTRSA